MIDVGGACRGSRRWRCGLLRQLRPSRNGRPQWPVACRPPTSRISQGIQPIPQSLDSIDHCIYGSNTALKSLAFIIQFDGSIECLPPKAPKSKPVRSRRRARLANRRNHSPVPDRGPPGSKHPLSNHSHSLLLHRKHVSPFTRLCPWQ